MSAFSGFLEKQLLGVTLLGSTFTTPSTLWVGLASSISSDCSSPADISEITTNVAYARVLLNGKLTAPTSGPNWTVSNSIDITFSAATTAWPLTVYYVTVMTSSTIGSGECMYYGLLETARTLAYADVLSFSAGTLSITLT